jgi:hypothetical protein
MANNRQDTGIILVKQLHRKARFVIATFQRCGSIQSKTQYQTDFKILFLFPFTVT